MRNKMLALCLTLACCLTAPASWLHAEDLNALRKSAEAGDAEAQFKLGGMYMNGEGAPKDDKEAAVWFRKAAEQGIPEAQYILGEFHFAGRGVPQNDAEAASWWIEAGNQQDFEYRLHALCQALELISLGRGVPPALEREQAMKKARQDIETLCPPELRGLIRDSR